MCAKAIFNVVECVVYRLICSLVCDLQTIFLCVLLKIVLYLIKHCLLSLYGNFFLKSD